MEFLMSIKTTIAALALAALAVTGGIASTTTQAEARPFGLGWGVGAGLVGAAVVGSAIAASNDGYYYGGYRRCGWVRQFDAYGNYIGRVRTCNY
jgi:nitric oxide reductase large subunit